MKILKMSVVAFALVLGVAASAFTSKVAKVDQTYYWFLTSDHSYTGDHVTIATEVANTGLSTTPNGTSVEQGFITATPPTYPGGTPDALLYN